jgi:hypothetical protein
MIGVRHYDADAGAAVAVLLSVNVNKLEKAGTKKYVEKTFERL